MPWARLDDHSHSDARLLALSDSAHRMWTCGLVFCSLNLTDGLIPIHAIHTFGIRARNKERVAEELCTPYAPGVQALWRKVEGGYHVNNYLDWNDSRNEVLAQRAKAKERIERHRGKCRFPRVLRGAMNGVCNDVAYALRTANNAPNERSEKHDTTYHVPQYVQKQEREIARSQRMEISESEPAQRLNERIRHHRRKRSQETDDGRPTVNVIAALARDVLHRHPDETDDGELRELLKAACSRANLKYDGRSVGDALEQAKAQLQRATS